MLTQIDPFRFRSAIVAISPTWLAEYWGERWQYTTGLMLDGLSEGAYQGCRARVPSDTDTPAGSLAEIGKDRVIVRGPQESDLSYAARLRGAFATWQRAGSAESVMRALQAYNLPFTVPAVTIPQGDGSARIWYTQASHSAPCIATRTTTSAWDWDGNAAEWARAWVVLHVSDALYPRTVIGGFTIGPSISVGIDYPPALVQWLRTLAGTWKAAQTVATVILSYDPDWPAIDGAGPSYPDGTWDRPYSATTGVSPRYAQALYLQPRG